MDKPYHLQFSFDETFDDRYISVNCSNYGDFHSSPNDDFP